MSTPAPASSARRREPAHLLADGLGGKGRYLLLGLFVVCLDQWSKWLVETRLSDLRQLEVIPGLLNLIHVRNTGVAFGLLASNGDPSRTLLLSALGLLALSVIGLYFWRTPPSHGTLLASLALILGGAVGNLLDRLASSAVTDFIDFYVGRHHWHTFNLADAAITTGIALMALDMLRSAPAGAPDGADPAE